MIKLEYFTFQRENIDKESMKYLIALIISISGVTASYKLLKPKYELPSNQEKREAVAQLKFDGDGVQKMPAGQAFWVDVQDGSELYEGDAVRTNERASAQVAFLGSETTLKIQPHTRFVVEKKDNKFVVGDVEGNLFVENAKALSDVQISAGGKTIDVTDGKAQINVSKGQVDLALKGGKVKTNVNGQERHLSGEQSGQLTDAGFKEKKVKFLNVKPVYDEYVYLKDESEPVSFSWEKIKGDYELKVYIGKSQKSMAALDEKSVVSKKDNEIKARVNLGEFYWKIVGIHKKNRNEVVYSDIYKFHSKKLYPPSLLGPIGAETVKFKKSRQKKLVKLNWGGASPLATSFVEVATDPEFKKVVFSDETSKKHMAIDMAEGQYYWRVTANLKNSKTYLKTGAQTFKVKYFNAAFPPKLLFPRPANQFILGDSQEKTDVTLNWERVDLAKVYRLLLTTKKGKKSLRIDKDIKDPTLFIKDMPEGDYEWKVATVDNEGQVSSYSAARIFSVKKPEQIKWLRERDVFEYIKQPDIKIGWSKTAGAKKWRIQFASNQDFKNSMTEIVKGNAVKLPIKIDGVYYIKVEALNEDEKVVAKSPVRAIQAREKPLPSSPKYHHAIKDRIMADSAGQLKLKFQPLPNPADRIIVKVVDQSGEIVRLHRMKSEQDTLTGLMPGKYYLNAFVQDKYERRSLPTNSLELNVPKHSYVQAPQVENIVIR